MNTIIVDDIHSAAGLSRPASSNPPQLSQGQILDATAECLGEHGYDGTTIRRIAGRLQCAVGSIYRYCDDKGTLLSMVTQRRLDPVVEAIEDHRPIGQSLRLYAQIATDAAEQYRLMFWLAGVSQPREGNARPVPAIVTRIVDGWSRQIGDPRAVQRLWAQLHGGLSLGLPVETLVNDLRQSFDCLAEDGEAAPITEHPPYAQDGELRHDGAALAATSRDREDLTML